MMGFHNVQIKAGLLRLRNVQGFYVKPLSCDDIAQGSRASLNPNFSHKRQRVKINIVDHSRQPLKEAKPTTETIQVCVSCVAIFFLLILVVLLFFFNSLLGCFDIVIFNNSRTSNAIK